MYALNEVKSEILEIRSSLADLLFGIYLGSYDKNKEALFNEIKRVLEKLDKLSW